MTVAMETANPIDLLFADMDRLGPGNDSHTLYVLRSLPRHRFDVIVDAGCGAGRQTLVLAKELVTPIHAVDLFQPFLNRLQLSYFKLAALPRMKRNLLRRAWWMPI